MKPKELTLKIAQQGAASLTDIELLTMIMGDEQAAYVLSEKAEKKLRKIERMYPSEISALPGMTQLKAMKVVAACEFARRKNTEEVKQLKTITSSSDIADYLVQKLAYLQHEVFYVVYLNRANKILFDEKISEGGMTGTVADPRIIMKRALDYGAVSLILSHNHPSGSLTPSKGDEEMTKKIKEACKYFDIKVLDHVIVSDQGYYSFADEGLL